MFKLIYCVEDILLDESIILPGSARHRVRLASHSLPAYHEQMPMVRLKAIFDSIKDVVLLRRFKVVVVELVIVCSLSDACGEDLISRYSITAVSAILLCSLLFVTSFDFQGQI